MFLEDQELGQFVTVPPFLMPHWDDLNTGGDLMTMGWDHLEASSFIRLGILFQLLPGNAGNQLETLPVASPGGLAKWAGLAFLTSWQQGSKYKQYKSTRQKFITFL